MCGNTREMCLPEECSFSSVTSLLQLLLACLWQDCMLPLLEMIRCSQKQFCCDTSALPTTEVCCQGLSLSCLTKAQVCAHQRETTFPL